MKQSTGCIRSFIVQGRFKAQPPTTHRDPNTYSGVVYKRKRSVYVEESYERFGGYCTVVWA